MALERKAPRMLNVCAHDLWTGDLMEETLAVVLLGYDPVATMDGRHGIVKARLLPVDPREEAGLGRTEDIRLFGWCEGMKVVRGMPLPTGSYLTQFDIWGNCHGYKYPPGSQKPCSCEWHD